MNIPDEKTSPIKAIIVKVVFGFMKPSKDGISLTQAADQSRYDATVVLNEWLK
tara:strand:+ start:481 stop:639 length:159 start_codon:yes stop_codon:yes gene_type:complete